LSTLKLAMMMMMVVVVVVVSPDVGDAAVCLRAPCRYVINVSYLYTYAINGYISFHLMTPSSASAAPYEPREHSVTRTFSSDRWFPILMEIFHVECKLREFAGVPLSVCFNYEECRLLGCYSVWLL
jgi:hypothetical protein